MGWLGVSAHGHQPSFFSLGHLPALLGTDKPLAKKLFEVHELTAYAIAALIVAHVASAARHAFILRDGVVARMLPAFGRGEKIG